MSPCFAGEGVYRTSSFTIKVGTEGDGEVCGADQPAQKAAIGLTVDVICNSTLTGQYVTMSVSGFFMASRG